MLTKDQPIMGICSWIVFGFFAGLVARAIFPGRQQFGIVATTALGVAGSFAGGFVSALISGHSWRTWSTSGFIGSILGALLLLWIGKMVKK